MSQTLEQMRMDHEELNNDIRHLLNKFQKKYGVKEFRLSNTMVKVDSTNPPICVETRIDLIF